MIKYKYKVIGHFFRKDIQKDLDKYSKRGYRLKHIVCKGDGNVTMYLEKPSYEV